MTVSELLVGSRKAHDAYRKSAGSIDKQGKPVPGNDALCVDAISQAYTLRMQAHAADPDHADPEWANDVKATHDSLVSFYAGYLS